jgi:recombinational DNA repair protein RecT
MTSGVEKHEVMTKAEIDKVRDEKSEAYKAFKAGKIKSTPWDSDYSEMAKKTVFRRCSKWLPLSAEILDASGTDDRDYIDAESRPVDRPTIDSMDGLAERLISQAAAEEQAANGQPAIEGPPEVQNEQPEILDLRKYALALGCPLNKVDDLLSVANNEKAPAAFIESKPWQPSSAAVQNQKGLL